MAEDQTFCVLDDAQTHHEARTHIEIRPPGSQRADFHEWAVAIQHQGNTFPDRHFAPGS